MSEMTEILALLRLIDERLTRLELVQAHPMMVAKEPVGSDGYARQVALMPIRPIERRCIPIQQGDGGGFKRSEA